MGTPDPWTLGKFESDPNFEICIVCPFLFYIAAQDDENVVSLDLYFDSDCCELFALQELKQTSSSKLTSFLIIPLVWSLSIRSLNVPTGYTMKRKSEENIHVCTSEPKINLNFYKNKSQQSHQNEGHT